MKSLANYLVLLINLETTLFFSLHILYVNQMKFTGIHLWIISGLLQLKTHTYALNCNMGLNSLALLGCQFVNLCYGFASKLYNG